MKNYFLICILSCSLIACSKSDDTQLQIEDPDAYRKITYETISGTNWKSEDQITSQANTRVYKGLKFNSDSTVSLLNITYKTAQGQQPSVNIITAVNDKIILKYKTRNSNNLNSTEKELLNTYDVLVFQEYGSLTDSEKQQYVRENSINAGGQTKIAFIYLRIDKEVTTDVKLIDTFKHSFSKVY